MTIKHFRDVPAQEVEQGAKGVSIRWVIARDDGAPNFAMRHFTIAPGGYTPHHAHAWEHEVYVLSGEGIATGPDGDTPIGAGSVVFVAPDDEHHFSNAGEEPLVFLCLVPFYEGCPR